MQADTTANPLKALQAEVQKIDEIAFNQLARLQRIATNEKEAGTWTGQKAARAGLMIIRTIIWRRSARVSLYHRATAPRPKYPPGGPLFDRDKLQRAIVPDRSDEALYPGEALLEYDNKREVVRSSAIPRIIRQHHGRPLPDCLDLASIVVHLPTSEGGPAL